MLSYIEEFEDYRIWRDLQYSQGDKCKKANGWPHDREHLIHKCQDMDPDTCYGCRPCQEHSLSSRHILVYTPHRDCQYTLAGTCKNLLHFVPYMLHLLHRETACKELVSPAGVAQLEVSNRVRGRLKYLLKSMWGASGWVH